MGVVWNQSPPKTWRFGIDQYIAQPIQEIASIRIIGENLTLFDPSDNDMMQRARGICFKTVTSPYCARKINICLSLFDIFT